MAKLNDLMRGKDLADYAANLPPDATFKVSVEAVDGAASLTPVQIAGVHEAIAEADGGDLLVNPPEIRGKNGWCDVDHGILNISQSRLRHKSSAASIGSLTIRNPELSFTPVFFLPHRPPRRW